MARKIAAGGNGVTSHDLHLAHATAFAILAAMDAMPIPPVSRPAAAADQRAPFAPWKVRLWSAALVLLFGTMLGFGVYLTPSPKGLATHMELGLPPCGFYTVTGYPCPTCGYTTAVTHVAHLQWFQAIATQPAGAAVGFLAIAAVIFGGIGMVTGRWTGPSPFFIAWHSRRITVCAVALVLAAWAYKIVIMTPWIRHYF